MKSFGLALRLLLRDGRSGELTVLLCALVIAVSASTAISLFNNRLQRTMDVQAAEFMAADLVVTSSTPLPALWLAKADQLHLARAYSAEFSSVLIENDELLLAGIKAVSAAYPLRGHLKTTDSDYRFEQTLRHGPSAGEAWVEQRVLSALHLSVGERLSVGEKALRITRILTYEPDKRGDLYSLSPRVMFNARDLETTGVIQPGSHVHYYFQFSGPSADLHRYKRWLKPRLQVSQRVMDIHEDRPELGSALNRTERYLGLSSIIVILIAGVAVAMATRRYSERHYDTCAVLRCLGCKQREVLILYSLQFITLGVLASLAGCLLGWFAQSGLFYLLQDLLPQAIASPSPLAMSFGFVTGMATLLGFALPPLLRLQSVPPLRVLRRERALLSSSAWFVYLLALSIISILLAYYVQDFKMTAIILGAGILLLLISGGVIRSLLWLSHKLTPHLGLAWRFGLQAILRQPQASTSQILAFGLTLVAMLLSFSVRTDLLDDFRAKLPKNAPNHFVLNIFPEQLDAFKQELSEQNIHGSLFYPVVRGRLVAINAIAVQRVVSKDSQGEAATHRDLSLTWSQELPPDNRITAGLWWPQSAGNWVSVEQKLAESLDLHPGDKLTFTIGSEQLQARVSSLRQVVWDTMKPNFYMIFSPGTLDDYPKTYMTSFFLPTAEKHKLNALVKKYPGITLLEVDQIIKQIKTLVRQLTQAIDYLLMFALLAGFTVLFAALYATLDERIYHGALLRTLGADRRLLIRSQAAEFALLGFLSGLLAVVIAEIIRFVLYNRLLSMYYAPDWLLWLLVPLSSLVFVTLAGCWGLRNVINKSPMQVFRQL